MNVNPAPSPGHSVDNTTEIKRPPSLNAGTHFLRAVNILTISENKDEYLAHLNGYLLMFKPQMEYQYRLAIRMGQNDWRLSRAAQFEKDLLQKSSYAAEVLKLQSTLSLYETRLEGNNNRCLSQMTKCFTWYKQWQAHTGEIGEKPVELLKSLAPEGNPYYLDVLKEIPVNTAEGLKWRAKIEDLQLSRQTDPVTPAQAQRVTALRQKAQQLTEAAWDKGGQLDLTQVPNPLKDWQAQGPFAPGMPLGDHQALFKAMGFHQPKADATR